MFTLNDILGLVGTLNDATGDDTAQQRFRRFLQESVVTLAAVRDYIDTCIRNNGSQYDHALQDLLTLDGWLARQAERRHIDQGP